MVTKMNSNTFRIVGENFGSIKLDDTVCKISTLYLKSPSEHMMDGSLLNGELQVYCESTKRGHDIVLVKMLAEVPKIEQGMPCGMGSFGFGSGRLFNLDQKVSLDEELALIEKNVFKNSDLLTHQPANLNSFFIQNVKFMKYKGKATFDTCKDVTYLISTDLAAFSTHELREIPKNQKYQPDFKTKDMRAFKMKVYKNYDRPKGYKSKKKPKKKKAHIMPKFKKPKLPSPPKTGPSLPKMPTPNH